MHFVIGTAGHVDHGKSALIKVLTGIETAHLPAEKQRGMTIELGFAHFTDSQDNTIGVIDVPGHERFIRNMVAGVWSLDMVLFVVAADEGWMPMSTDHLRVIHSMGIKQVLLVITKSDLVDSETLELVEEEALENFMDIAGILPDSMTVSAHSNTNIDKLKSKISQQLQQVERVDSADGAHLYIDRVFTVNGIGTTVTGSLVGGSFSVGQTLVVQPTGQQVKIKSLQSYHQNIERAEPVSRVAVCLKGIKRKEVEKGFSLVAEKELGVVADEFIVRLDEWPEKSQCKNNSEIEVALGTFNTLAVIYFFKDTKLARIRLKKKVSCAWNQRILLIQHGGSKIVNSGSIMWTGAVPRHLRAKLALLLDSAPDQLGWNDYVRLNLELYGYAQLRDDSGELDGDFIRCGDWLFLPSSYEEFQDKILVMMEGELMSFTCIELSSKLNLEAQALEQILSELVSKGKLRLDELLYTLGNGRSEEALSPSGKKLLHIIRTGEKNGFEADKQAISGAQKDLRVLVRQDFIVPLEGKIYYDSEVYSRLVSDIMFQHEKHQRFSIAEAKERTGLSRKFMIPLLNKMEKDGWIKRHENDREVVRELVH